MIPEAYWRIIGRWWWLIGVLFIMGSGLGYALSQAWVIHESEAVIEVNYLQGPDGTVSFDEYGRRLEANRLASELDGPWVSRQLKEAITNAALPPGFTPTTLDIQVSAPSRSQTAVGPATIVVKAQNSDADSAEMAAGIAAQTYAAYIIERQATFMTAQENEAIRRAEQLSVQLKDVLERKRAALNDEATRVDEATQDLLNTHNQLLAQLPIILDDFRRQIGTANEAGTDTVGVDQAISLLRSDIEALQNEWKSGVSGTLDTLYSAQSQPDYQLAVAEEAALRIQYDKALNALIAFGDNDGLGDPVRVLELGTEPMLVPVLGLQKRYIMVGGGFVGLLLGWLLANLADYIVLSRSRKRAQRPTPVREENGKQQTVAIAQVLPANGNGNGNGNGKSHEAPRKVKA